MKKLFLFCAVALSLTARAEVITLDPASAADIMLSPISYNTQNVWDSTYSEDGLCQLLYCNDGKFALTHLPSGNSWGGTAWDGFTVSKVTTNDPLDQFACVAKGGVNGEGTPYILGFYSEYYTLNNEDEMPSSNIISFDDAYYPVSMAVCQTSQTLNVLQKGNAFAKAFTKDDTFAIIITALNNVYEPTNSVTYYLAMDSIFNQGWETIDLSPLGNCMHLSITMTSTDMSYGFMNTPAYFALDALKISTEAVTTAIPQTAVQPRATKRLVDGTLYIEQDGVLYTVTGIRL